MIGLGMKIRGMIRLQRRKAESGLIMEEMEFPNLIVNDGLDLIGSDTIHNISDYCACGTDNTAPAVTQTALGSELARTNTLEGTYTIANSGSSPWYHTLERTFTFAVGAATGTIAEIGFFNTTAPGTMFSRALVTTPGGTPTTITVLSDEQLYVTYTIYLYPASETVGTGTVTINTVNYDWEMLPSEIDSASGLSFWSLLQTLYPYTGFAYATQTLGAITEHPAGTTYTTYDAGCSLAAYTPGTYYRDATLVWGPTYGNTGSGIGSVSAGKVSGTPGGGWQMNFDPVIPKTSDDQFELTIRYSWARHT